MIMSTGCSLETPLISFKKTLYTTESATWNGKPKKIMHLQKNRKKVTGEVTMKRGNPGGGWYISLNSNTIWKKIDREKEKEEK